MHSCKRKFKFSHTVFAQGKRKLVPMSLLLPTVNHTPHLPPPPPYDTPIAATNSHKQRSSMLNKLSKRFSIRSSKPQAESSDNTSKSTQGGLLAPASNNPFTTGSPATRRPSEITSLCHCFIANQKKTRPPAIALHLLMKPRQPIQHLLLLKLQPS